MYNMIRLNNGLKSKPGMAGHEGQKLWNKIFQFDINTSTPALQASSLAKCIILFLLFVFVKKTVQIKTNYKQRKVTRLK